MYLRGRIAKLLVAHLAEVFDEGLNGLRRFPPILSIALAELKLHVYVIDGGEVAAVRPGRVRRSRCATWRRGSRHTMFRREEGLTQPRLLLPPPAAFRGLRGHGREPSDPKCSQRTRGDTDTLLSVSLPERQSAPAVPSLRQHSPQYMYTAPPALTPSLASASFALHNVGRRPH